MADHAGATAHPWLGQLTRRRFLALAGGTVVMVSCRDAGDGDRGEGTNQQSRAGTAAPGAEVRLFADDGSAAIAPPPRGDVTKVIVVGAGIAGLTVARALHLSGVEVVVIEGRDRIGGRTHTVDLTDVPVDLGASWVHPGTASAMAPLFDELGVSLLPAGITDLVTSGVAFDRATGAFPGPEVAGALLATLGPLELGNPADVLTGPANETMGQVIDRLVAGTGLSGPSAVATENAANGLLALPSGADIGGDRATTYLGGDSEASGPDDTTADIDDDAGDIDRFPEGGYRSMVDALAEGLDIELESPIDTVTDTGTGVTVSGPGKEFSGSHAVVTVPLGVLKAGRLTFVPPLDAAKQAAVDRVGFGAFEKVALAYDEAFWQVDGEPRAIIVADPNRSTWPLILDLSAWYGAPVVVALTAGDSARAVAELPADERVRQVSEILAEIGGPNSPGPVASASSAWTTSPFTGGCYSGLFSAEATEDDLAVLGEPAGRVMFAGEATSPLEYASVDGAWVSGIREAKRLLQRPQVPIL